MLKKFVVLAVLLINILFFPTSSVSVEKTQKPAIVLQHPNIPILSFNVVSAWEKVAICEEGGDWNHFTYFYPDALGINRLNWIQFGGSVKMHSSEATQIEVATRMIQYYHQDIPDRGYCAAW